jgi:hypothetical protein
LVTTDQLALLLDSGVEATISSDTELKSSVGLASLLKVCTSGS